MKLVADDLSGSQWLYQESVLCRHSVSVTNEFTIQEQHVDVNLSTTAYAKAKLAINKGYVEVSDENGVDRRIQGAISSVTTRRSSIRS